MMSHEFIVTKEHRRFIEFANAVRKEKTIGICHGAAGVGKTNSARRYANWDTLEPYINEWGPRGDHDAKHYALANRSRTVFYTPEVLCRPKDLMHDIDHWQMKVGTCADEHLRTLNPDPGSFRQRDVMGLVELLIIDEAERLTPTGLELLRDQHDRTHLAIILIGMPGIDERFRHYPQLFSRLGFSHQYRPLGREELLFVLDRHWKRLGKTLDSDDFTDAQTIAAIERITRGNFRLLERLFPQINRVLKLNQLDTITDDVVEAAASILVIGN
jgi:DNA transposition AAA+ family ATPase